MSLSEIKLSGKVVWGSPPDLPTPDENTSKTFADQMSKVTSQVLNMPLPIPVPANPDSDECGNCGDIHPPEYLCCTACGECYQALCFCDSGKCTVCCNDSDYTPKESVSKEVNAAIAFASGDWQLPYEFNCTAAAAEFYLLYALNLRGLDQGMFNEWMEVHLPVFKKYTDMVVGGELRHVIQQGASEENLQYLAWSDLCPEPHPSSREAMWKAWYGVRQEWGIDALKDAKIMFDSMGYSNAFGGELWGNIAENLIYLEEGQISPTLFIDLCFGLVHNGGVYLDKLGAWNSNSLKKVLNINLSGKLENLVQYAGSEVKEVWRNAL